MTSARRIVTARGLAVGLLVCVGIGAIAVAGWSLAHGGIGWDSRGDTEAAVVTRSVDSSWTLARAYASVPFGNEFYGVFLQQFADALHLLFSGTTTFPGADDPAAYVYQGLANVILSVLSVTALAIAVGVAFRSVLAGAFLWSLTLSTPLWLGMSHVDFKDMPLASGLTLVTAGLTFSCSISPPRWSLIVGVVLCGSGGAIALASRPGSLPLLTALAVGSAISVFAIGRSGKVRALPTEVAAGAALAGALVFTWATNPIARIDMPKWLENSTAVARSFPWNSTIRTAGRDVRSTDLPLWYVPAWIGAQLPLLTLAAVLGGAGLLIVILIRQTAAERLRTALPLVPIALQGIVLPVATVASGAVLYDGIRHLLYMLPALMAIPAVALATLDRRLRASRRGVLLPLVAVVVAATSLFASIRWAPYAYAFVNPVAGRNTDTRDWELDYWGVSAREGVRRLERLGLTPVHVQPTAGPAIPWGAASGPVEHGSGSGLYVFLRYNRAADFGCRVLFTIKRDGHVLGEGARCG